MDLDRTFWAEPHDGQWFIMYQPLKDRPRETWPAPVRLLKYNLDAVPNVKQMEACIKLALILDRHNSFGDVATKEGVDD